jgi:branched-chain amino acid transport system substrate-binding protein
VNGKVRRGAPLLAVVLIIGLAGCGSSSSSSGGSAGSSSNAAASSSGSGSSSASLGSPVKIAVLPPGSGPLVPFGAAITQGWQFAADQANASGGVDGHKVQIITSDDDGTPAGALQAAQKAVQADGAKFLTGTITSPETAAVEARLGGLGALDLNTISSDTGLTGAACSANAFHFIPNTIDQLAGMEAQIKSTPAKKWALLVYDYSTGISAAQSFGAAVKAAGDQVVQTQYIPLTTTDYGSYLSKLQSSGADGFFGVIAGSGAISFIKQAEQYGVWNKLKAKMGYSMVNELDWSTIGAGANGFYNEVLYTPSVGTGSSNAAFLSAWQQKYGGQPNYQEATAYLAAQVLFAAMNQSRSIDPMTVRAALSGHTFSTIIGSVEFRPGDNQLLRPLWAGRVVKSGPGYQWDVVQRIDKASPKSSACSL